VSITTDRGTLFLTAQGTGCPGPTTATSVDTGKWTALGGTGIFEGARGGGVFHSVGMFNADHTISSTSNYSGTLVLNN
jgi:hypothetical protein